MPGPASHKYILINDPNHNTVGEGRGGLGLLITLINGWSRHCT